MEEDSKPKNTGKTILIVEDERPLAKALQLKLTSNNFNVLIADDGEKAVEYASSGNVDLILLDMVMPKLDGFGVLKALKEKGINTPVVVVSNLSQTEDIAKVKDYGVKDYFIKSNTPLSDIVDYINKRLGNEAA